MANANDKQNITVLVVDDEESIIELLDLGLGREGYRVLSASTGTDGLELYRKEHPDLVILDWMLPEMEGIEVCRRIRAADNVPIIMLTAKDTLEDKVKGFETGADDYLAKPFKFKELLMRVKSLLRRAGANNDNKITYNDLVLDRAERRVFRDNKEVELTTKEFEILEYFITHPRQVLTKEQILDTIWGWDYPGGANTVEVHVSALRTKLGDNDRRLIRTVRGVGYALN
ncbi:MAG: response regulator transcription factor [bacterium]|nr:response regulator transcription factor [bacterium]